MNERRRLHMRCSQAKTLVATEEKRRKREDARYLQRQPWSSFIGNPRDADLNLAIEESLKMSTLNGTRSFFERNGICKTSRHGLVGDENKVGGRPPCRLDRKNKGLQDANAGPQDGSLKKTQRLSKTSGAKSGGRTAARATRAILGSCSVTGDKVEDNPQNDSDRTSASHTEILIPAWRITERLAPSYQLEGTENLEDSEFRRRHARLEQEERRERRWAQQCLEESRDGGPQSSPAPTPLSSFLPDPSQATEIEVVENDTVFVFGQALPPLQQQDFKLPWKVRRRCSLATSYCNQ